MEEYHPRTYGEAFADVYDEWYSGVTDTAACVAAVARLAGGGPVLEMGAGTGRLALPLAAAGADAWALDASQAMLTTLVAKPGGERVRPLLGDMARPPLRSGAGFSVVLCAFNSLFNLPDAAEQRLCLQAAAGLLAPAGRLIVETSLPGTGHEPGETEGIATEPGEFQVDSVDVRAIESDRVVLSAWQHDPVSQNIRGQMIDITAAGIRLRPWQLHYRTAPQLDAAARDAGLELVERWADWQGGRFDPVLSTEQIALYRRRR
ncbi:MAG: methyltransferase domain-containing protein [bacterium]|nr:methyltransferase domain-containing protein [bacterium]